MSAGDDDKGAPGPDNVIPIDKARAKRKPKAASGKYLAVLRELENNPLTASIVAYDTFSHAPMLMRPVPMPDGRIEPGFTPRLIADHDYVDLVMHLEGRGFAKVGPSVVRDVIGALVQRNRISPPAELIKSLVWDGVERLSRFFLDYAGVEIEGDTVVERIAFTSYVEAVTRCVFISIVARVMRPGCKVDTLPILEGLQGLLKSTLLRVMALRDEWFSDNMPHDLSSKDARQHLPGKLIIELSEFNAVKASDVEAVKAFLSTQEDRYRPSYGHHEVVRPRQGIFAATTNASEYLKDATGNRRFWPLRTTIIDVAGAKDVIQQVYAEAYAAFRAGERWWLDAGVDVIARNSQESRREVDPWEELIAEFVATLGPDADGVRWTTVKDVFDHLGVKPERQSKSEQMRAAAVLRRMGAKRKFRRLKGVEMPVWIWFL